MLILLARTREASAFRLYDCNNQSVQVEQYSLLDLEPCGNMENVHAIEGELYEEIVQIQKGASGAGHSDNPVILLWISESFRGEAVLELPRADRD
jgi:hypothetical protein